MKGYETKSNEASGRRARTRRLATSRLLIPPALAGLLIVVLASSALAAPPQERTGRLVAGCHIKTTFRCYSFEPAGQESETQRHPSWTPQDGVRRATDAEQTPSAALRAAYDSTEGVDVGVAGTGEAPVLSVGRAGVSPADGRGLEISNGLMAATMLTFVILLAGAGALIIGSRKMDRPVAV